MQSQHLMNKNLFDLVFVYSAETNTCCTRYITLKLLHMNWQLCLFLCLSFAQPELFNSEEKRTKRDKGRREISRGKVKSEARDRRLQYITERLQRLLPHVFTMLLHSYMCRWSVKTRLLFKTHKKMMESKWGLGPCRWMAERRMAIRQAVGEVLKVD